MKTASAQIETDDAVEVLKQIYGRLSESLKAKDGVIAQVEWSESDGRVDFGWGRCLARANASGVLLHAEADDEDSLGAIREIVSRHLEHASEGIVVRWDLAEAAPAEPNDGRDRMREFHRRARHQRRPRAEEEG